MTINEALRLLAGVMLLISTALTWFVADYWVLLTIFIALNLLQSAFTRWCPAITILRKLGLRED